MRPRAETGLRQTGPAATRLVLPEKGQALAAWMARRPPKSAASWLVRYLPVDTDTEPGGGIVPIANPMGPAAGLAASSAPTAAAGGATHSFKLWGKDGFTFGDILDAVNPLEQLPVVGTIYRHLTGHSISPASRIMGGALFGGPIGAALSALNAVVEASSGKGIGERVLEALEGGGNGTAPSERVASSGAPAGVFPSGRPADASAGRTAANRGTAVVVQLEPAVRPGGWMVNAAYTEAVDGSDRGAGAATADAAVSIRQVASRGAQMPRPVHRPRPGGWMVNAAYASLDAGERQRAGIVSASA